MQDRGDDRLRIQVHLGQEAGHCDRMGDIGFARQAGLALVGEGAEFVRLHHLLDQLGRHVGLQYFDELL